MAPLGEGGSRVCTCCGDRRRPPLARRRQPRSPSELRGYCAVVVWSGPQASGGGPRPGRRGWLLPRTLEEPAAPSSRVMGRAPHSPPATATLGAHIIIARLAPGRAAAVLGRACTTERARSGSPHHLGLSCAVPTSLCGRWGPCAQTVSPPMAPESEGVAALTEPLLGHPAGGPEPAQPPAGEQPQPGAPASIAAQEPLTAHDGTTPPVPSTKGIPMCLPLAMSALGMSCRVAHSEECDPDTDLDNDGKLRVAHPLRLPPGGPRARHPLHVLRCGLGGLHFRSPVALRPQG
eukprot:scaffold1674_cov340-Prasinococcus_capsulatus_cf.AAC.4